MATILINNPSKREIMQYMESTAHYVEADGIILAMSDLSIWFKKYEVIHDFMNIDNGYTLCKVDRGETIYSEENTLIINENENQ